MIFFNDPALALKHILLPIISHGKVSMFIIEFSNKPLNKKLGWLYALTLKTERELAPGPGLQRRQAYVSTSVSASG